MAKSPFIGTELDGIVPTPTVNGDWGGTTDGYPISGGKKADSSSWVPEVTTVKIGDDPGIGGDAAASNGTFTNTKTSAPIPIKG